MTDAGRHDDMNWDESPKRYSLNFHNSLYLVALKSDMNSSLSHDYKNGYFQVINSIHSSAAISSLFSSWRHSRECIMRILCLLLVTTRAKVS
jgi:hypothetical protein